MTVSEVLAYAQQATYLPTVYKCASPDKGKALNWLPTAHKTIKFLAINKQF
jgi:hypothetical protein